MDTIELCLEIDDRFHDRVIAELDELGGEGYVQEHNLLKAYVSEASWSPEKKNLLHHYLLQLSVESNWKEQVIEDQDWNEPWEKSITPITVGEFYIRPSWGPSISEEDKGLVEIIIDPKMSFGTGHHETTRLVLRELDDYVNRGDSILDAGVGTAILSIAALKKGATAVIGFDIDEWAINNGLENARRNGVSEQIELRKGSFERVGEEDFDVVFANINLNVLLDHTTFFSSKLKDGGYLLLSGVLRTDAPLIKEAFESEGFAIIRNTFEGEWHCCVMQKKEQSQ